jgi:hypothetical protein
MKKIIALLVCSFLFENCFSQAGEWVWLKGPNVSNDPGNSGVMGIPSPTNNPPSLYEPCEWTDLNGNFWLFGGLDSLATPHSKLWMYNPVTNNWTWMRGNSFSGNYGIQGVSSPTNDPPARSYGVNTWVDTSGNLWMFGGQNGPGSTFSDLWKYDVSTNEWTWMKGPNTTAQLGVYGVPGVPSPANYPAARNECAASWTDNSGNLWLYGGWGSYMYSDLWRYNIATNEWTWMKGVGPQLPVELAVYGSLGIEDSANTPGFRYIYTHWKDYSGKL